jgi:hypothetical protein
VRIDLVRTADGKSTAEDPLTHSNVSAVLDELADRIEVNWPDVPRFVAHRAEFCRWRLRELSENIAHPDGIVIARDSAGRVCFSAPPGTLDLLDLLGQAMNVCQRVEKGWERDAIAGELPPHGKLRNLAKLICAEVTRATGSDRVEYDPAYLERDKWLYEQRQTKSMIWNAVLAEFKKVRAQRGWQAVDLHGIRSAVERYAKALSLPLRKGHAGRPTKAK